MPVVKHSATKQELLQQIDDVHNAIMDFYRDVPDDIIMSSADPEGWSVVRNMKHVASTNKLMSRWVGMPGGLLKLLGRPKKPGLKVEDLVPTNRPNLREYGRYHTHEKSHPEVKARLLEKIAASVTRLKHAVDKRTEEELDIRRAPFGGMTLRMFVHFVLKHNIHHTNVARTRLEE
ncbi:MAG: DinB family protein [Spirochaetia bacterium]|nr:DinB family protein [Spirochaetia bacterium]